MQDSAVSAEQAVVRDACIGGGVLWEAAPASRGGQIAAGVALAQADLIWVVHTDCGRLDNALDYLLGLATKNDLVWGRFDVHLSGNLTGLSWVARSMNWRSRLTKICTGDQGMFFHRSLLKQIGGFPDQPLMEDIEVSKRLRGRGQFLAPKISILSSGERWQKQGLVRTVLSMWGWRLRYFFGGSPERLYRDYYGRAPKGDQ